MAENQVFICVVVSYIIQYIQTWIILISEESNPQKTKAYGFPGKVYNGILLQKMLARSYLECTNQCIRHIDCCAGVYNKVTKECSLMRKSDNNEETTHSFHEDDDCSSFLI
ncbi:Hypothetical predicted protein [Mytilus galloprovincialis]|uniref:Apple domain-containing protein n=1 Tax=Mytilus galloprovincialis TaxID=29158 RepID=A0A8B6DWJ2_MYTGA|nr:Hypothetical predicted protein [Mytilus galloprovincialis]